MATNINTILNWFLTDLKPTQEQFWATFLSFRHKDDPIPQSAISNLTTVLAAKAENDQFNAHKTANDAHQAQFDLKEDKANKGVVNGYAPLDEFIKVASVYLNIVDDLVTGGIDSLLSAEQGKVLQEQIDGINLLLTSNDVNLDTVQEIVDAIRAVSLSLETILVNDLTTGGVTKALTAEMGKSLKALIDGHLTDGNAHTDQFNAREDKNKKGVANGYTPLDSIGKVPKAHLKDYVYNTFFVDTIDGDDPTAEFENPSKPYYSSAYVKTLSSYNENKIITIIK